MITISETPLLICTHRREGQKGNDTLRECIKHHWTVMQFREFIEGLWQSELGVKNIVKESEV